MSRLRASAGNTGIGAGGVETAATSTTAAGGSGASEMAGGSGEGAAASSAPAGASAARIAHGTAADDVFSMAEQPPVARMPESASDQVRGQSSKPDATKPCMLCNQQCVGRSLDNNNWAEHYIQCAIYRAYVLMRWLW